jgi:hypothetical protein
MKQKFNIVEIKETPLSIGEYFLSLLHSATNTHLLHLQSRSFSQHMALGTYYEEVVELIDSLIEAYQGKNQIIVQYPNIYYPPVDDALTELINISTYVIKNRAIVGNDTELQNITDEIQQLIDSTIYKLTFLK